MIGDLIEGELKVWAVVLGSWFVVFWLLLLLLSMLLLSLSRQDALKRLLRGGWRTLQCARAGCTCRVRFAVFRARVVLGPRPSLACSLLEAALDIARLPLLGQRR